MAGSKAATSALVRPRGFDGLGVSLEDLDGVPAHQLGPALALDAVGNLGQGVLHLGREELKRLGHGLLAGGLLGVADQLVEILVA